MLDLFEAHGMPITCYAVGQALEKNPEVAKALPAGGHEIASHAYRWIDYHCGYQEWRVQIRVRADLEDSDGSRA